MYHDVVDGDAWNASGFAGGDADIYKLERSLFEKHLAAIAESIESKPIKVSDLLSLSSNVESSENSAPLLLTFDDGGVSAYTHIADALERYGWRGHFFVTAGYIGQPAFMKPEQIRELHARGHVIGSHSMTHPMRMSACSSEEMMREWTESIEILSEITGERIKAASVPGGHYSTKVAETAARAGLEALFTSEPTMNCRMVDGCLVIGRYSIQRSASAEDAAALAVGESAPRLRQAVLWKAKKAAKALGGEQYLKVRKSLLR